MPSYEVQLRELPGVPLAVVRRQVPRAGLGAAVRDGCGRAFAFARRHNLSAGRNVAVYWDGSIRLDAGVELPADFAEADGIVRSATPAGRGPRRAPWRLQAANRMLKSLPDRRPLAARFRMALGGASPLEFVASAAGQRAYPGGRFRRGPSGHPLTAGFGRAGRCPAPNQWSGRPHDEEEPVEERTDSR
jgi:hypothetical protein